MDAVLDLNIKEDDKYYIAFDYVVDNQDIRNKYRMLKSITDKSEGKIVILDMICFEYLILAFDKLVEWTGTGKTDKIKIREKVLGKLRITESIYQGLMIRKHCSTWQVLRDTLQSV